MNKPLLTLAACVALGGASLSAAVATIEGSDGEYATLEDAVAAAQTGAVITVHESYTSKASRSIINIEDGRALTIKGDDGVVISYSNLFVVNLASNTNNSLSLENITFKNTTPGTAANRNTFNIARGNASFKNVTIDGAYVKENNNRGIVFVNSGSNVTSVEFDNFKLLNCKVEPSAEGITTAEVVLNYNGNVTLKNDCQMDIKLGANGDKTSFSIIEDATTFTGHANLVLDGQAVGAKLVNNCADASLFTVTNAPEGTMLAAQKVGDANNLVLINTPTVINENTTTTYDSFDAAINAVKDGETLVLCKDVTFTTAYTIRNKSITIKGATGEERIVNGDGFTAIMFSTTDGKTLTLSNLIIDGDNVERAISWLRPSNGSDWYIENVKFVNCDTTFGRGIIDNSTSDNRGRWHIKNVVMTDCSVPMQEVTSIANGNTISGNNSFTLRINSTGATTDDEYYTVDANGIANDAHQNVTLDRTLLDKTVITNCNVLWQFFCTNDGYQLNPIDGNLVFGKWNGTQTGVDDIEIESNDTPEYWYNLNGLRLAQKPTTPGLYIRRCGDKATKVFVK